MYNLDDINERVREYIAARHPCLHLDDNCSLRVLPDADPRYASPDPWMFFIEYRNPAMTKRDMVSEFMRYTSEIPFGSMESWEGCGNDYITVRSGQPLCIGDGDDSGAIECSNGVARIWLRKL